MPKRFKGKVELQYSQTKIMRSNLSVDFFIKQSCRLRSKKQIKYVICTGPSSGGPGGPKRVKLCPRGFFPCGPPGRQMACIHRYVYLKSLFQIIILPPSLFYLQTVKRLKYGFLDFQGISLHNTL